MLGTRSTHYYKEWAFLDSYIFMATPSSCLICRRNLTRFRKVESEALFKSFDKYSSQNVNIIVYILIAKFMIYDLWSTSITNSPKLPIGFHLLKSDRFNVWDTLKAWHLYQNFRRWYNSETEVQRRWGTYCLEGVTQGAHSTHTLMMTSSNGKIFRVTGLLWGESTGHR